jgi:predicted RNase H-like HicB family nuclease
MATHRFQVLIELDEDGWYIACVPALECCHAQGRTKEEALANVREVVGMCLRELAEDGKCLESCSEVIAVETIEVEG